MQVALGGPHGRLGSEFLFLQLGCRYLLCPVSGVRAESLSGSDVCGLGVGWGSCSGVGSGSVASGTGSVLLLGPASSTVRTGDLRSIR